MTVVPYLDLADGATRAGFRGAALATIVAIANMETRRGKALPADGRVAEPNGSTSFGVYQINSIHLRSGGLLEGWSEDRLATDHAYGAAAAWRISKSGTTFDPWTTYRLRTTDFLSPWAEGYEAAAAVMYALPKLADLSSKLASQDLTVAALRAAEAAAEATIASLTVERDTARAGLAQSEADLVAAGQARDAALSKLASLKTSLVDLSNSI